MKTVKDLNKLNLDAMMQVMNDLLYYDETHVIYENGKYNVSPNLMLCSSYAADRKFIGTWYAKDVYPDLHERDMLRVAKETIEHRQAEIMFEQAKGSRPYPKAMLTAIDTAMKTANGY